MIGSVPLAVFAAVLLGCAALAVVGGRDMARRGRPGEAYGLALFFCPPVGLPMWLLDRRRFPVGGDGRGTAFGERPPSTQPGDAEGGPPAGCPMH